MKKIILLLLVIANCISSYGQTPVELLDQYLTNYHSEKLYVSHDKPYYIIGETIWCKVYLVDAVTHQSYAAEPVVYIDWVNPEGQILNTYYLKIKDGTAHLDIPTEPTTKAGNYTLRAYTLYQKNFDQAFIFQKEVAITDFYEDKSETPANDLDFDLQFFPEGGDLVAGLMSRVAFKTQNEKGTPVKINGVLETSDGQSITTIKTLNEGMGFFNLSPKKGEKYWVRATYEDREKRFALPSVIAYGYGLKCDTRSSQKIKISLISNTTNLLKDCQLVGHLRGQVFYNQKFDNKGAIKLAIDTKEIPTGLLTFTLFDAQQRPVCERLIFNKNLKEKVVVKLALSKTEINKRSLVTGDISTLRNDTIIPSKLSVSVYNASLVPDDLQGLTIENYLHVQSDLKGRVHNINQYFESDDAKTRTLLDLLLMTHGWRRFTWQQIVEQQKLDLIYPIETSFSFSGQVTKELKDKPVKANVFLSVLDDKNYGFANGTTGPDGLFHFEGFNFEDTTNLLLQANIYNERKLKKLKKGEVKRVGNKSVDIELFQLQELPFDPSLTLKNGLDKPEKVLKKFSTEVAEVIGQEMIDTSLWTIDLSEVTVRTKQLTYRQKRYVDLQKKYRELGMFYFSSTDKFFTEDLYKYASKFTDVFDLIRHGVPTAKLAGPPANRRVYLSNAGLIGNGPGVTLALNGQIMSAGQLYNIPPEAIYAIEVLYGLRASALYNSAPIIVLLTKDDKAVEEAISKAQDVGMTQISHPGFYQAKAFYTPRYDQSMSDKPEPDYRITLHWLPNVKLTDTAQQFEFHTGDIEGNYLIWIEGITNDGIPFTSKASFFVK